MSGLVADSFVRRVEGVILRQVAGETFLVPIRGRLADMEELFVLNEVGRWLWDGLDGLHSIEDLAANVAAEFEVEEQEACRDALAFVERLAESGLVEESSPPGS